MRGASSSRSRWRNLPSAIADNPTVLWAAFVLAHFWLGYLDLNAPGLPLGDVTLVYKYWAEQASLSGFVVGIDSIWVYPIVAILPIVGAAAFGFVNYVGTWLSMVFLLDAIAFAALIGWRGSHRTHRSSSIGWWWIAFLLLLGPIALGRIDSITIPIAIVAVLLLASRPRAAAVLLTIATWIKVWPAAIIAAVVVASGARRRVATTVVVTSLAIIAIALALGSGFNVFSFVSQQTGRGLQVEAPVSTIWMWLSLLGVPGAFVYYDQGILTYQVGGPGADLAAAVMTPVLGIAAIVILLVGVLAVRRGATVSEVLPALALALTSALFAFNKVGSPQYMTWLAVPVILGLATFAAGYGRSFRVPAALVLVMAALTQGFYPYLYLNLLELDPLLVIVLTARNLLLFVLFGWAITQLWRVSRRSAQHEAPPEATSWLPSVWPFHNGVTPDSGMLEGNRTTEE